MTTPPAKPTEADGPHAPPWAWRAGGLLAAVLLAGWALTASGFRDWDGWLLGPAALPLAGAAALAVAAFGAGTRWTRSANWAAVLLLGQAAALRLTVATSQIRYQRFHPWGDENGLDLLPVALLTIQAGLVAWAIGGRSLLIARWFGKTLRPWQLLALLGACFISGAAVSEHLKLYVAELFASFAVDLIQVGTVVLLAWDLPTDGLRSLRGRLEPLLGPSSTDPDDGGLDRFACTLAVGVTVISALLAVVVYEAHPHVQDEVKYLMQARYLAAGTLGMTPPPVAEAFEVFLMDVGPRGWYAVTPPGWSGVLAIGSFFGVPWLVNPLLAGLCVLIVYPLLRTLVPLRTARIATLLFAVSPWSLFLGMSFMSHHLTLACFAGAALTVVKVRRGEGDGWAWTGGLLLGVILATRQLDGAVAAVLVGLWAIGVGGKRVSVVAVAGLVVASAAVVGGLLFYNGLYMDSPLQFPIMEYIDAEFGPGRNGYGFGANRGLGWPMDPNPGHGPLDGAINANLNVSAIDVELFGWGFGSLWIVYLLVVRGKLQLVDKQMLAVIGLTFTAYFFNYFGGGPDFGARYWWFMIVPGVVLGARAVQRIGWTLDYELGETRVLVALGALMLGTVTVFIPWRALDKYHGFRGMRPGIVQLAEEHDFGRSLVIIRGQEVPDYASAVIYNPLDVTTGETVYAWEPKARADAELAQAWKDAAGLRIAEDDTRLLGLEGGVLSVDVRTPAALADLESRRAEVVRALANVDALDLHLNVRIALAEAYPDRTFWLVDGLTLTGEGYAVRAGPFTAAELREHLFDDDRLLDE